MLLHTMLLLDGSKFFSNVEVNFNSLQTRPSALGMSDPIWGPLIHIYVDEKKN